MRMIGTALVLALLAISSPALAQKEDKAAAGKVKVFDFSADEITGDLIKPDGTGVDARVFGVHSSLIRIRKHFFDEILKSAEDL